MKYSCISIRRASTCKDSRVLSNKFRVLFDPAFQNNTQNVQDFFESLVNIVAPVRQAMSIHGC